MLSYIFELQARTGSINGNWDCGWSVPTAGKSLSALELSVDNTSDQKFSSISGNSSDESNFMHMLLLISPVVKEETSLEHCCGEIGLCSMPSDPARFDKFMNSGSAFNAWLDLEMLMKRGSISGVAWVCLSLFFKWVCHTFFISLSVRPGNLAAIADHLKNGEKKKKLCQAMH